VTSALRRRLARVPLVRASRAAIRRLGARVFELLPATVAARRTAAEIRNRGDWVPGEAIEIVDGLSGRLRALGAEGAHAESRWLHHRWLTMFEDVFSAIGADVPPNADAVCMGAGTRNPLAFPLLLYLAGARRVWIVEPELADVASWRTRWGLQELILRVLTGDVTSSHFVRPPAAVDGFVDLQALFFAPASSSLLRENTVRTVRGYLEDAPIPAASVGLVTSRSVLEHVTEIERCLDAFAAMLVPGGVMCHSIDLTAHDARDRFAFYYDAPAQHGRRPDDLNGWRLPDYVSAFAARGFDCRVIHKTVDTDYVLDRSRLRDRYRRYDDDALLCSRAVLVCRKPPTAA
jgi:hypothetical protein